MAHRSGDGERRTEVLNQVYDSLRLYTNFFQPVMKLVEKERIGNKVRQVYDKAKTPYERPFNALLMKARILNHSRGFLYGQQSTLVTYIKLLCQENPITTQII